MNSLYGEFLANQEINITGNIQKISISVNHPTSFHINGVQFQIGQTHILEFNYIQLNSFYFDEDVQATITYLK